MIVNIKPFAPQVGSGLVPIPEAVEMIDVAGVALLSSAARNHASVVAVSDPADYPVIVEEIRRSGSVGAETRRRLAARAFATVAAYNAEVAGYLNHVDGVRFPDQLTVVLEKQRDLPYGKTPTSAPRSTARPRIAPNRSWTRSSWADPSRHSTTCWISTRHTAS